MPIREAQLSDLPTMLGISQRAFGTPWSKASFEAEFRKPYSRTYLYMRDEQVVAYLTIWIINDEGEVVSLAVDKGWRNKGFATQLLKYVFDNNAGLKFWHLEVAQDNDAALSLYRTHGFERMRVIKNYYGGGQDAIQMKRERS
jgi:ribosomal-protein-alanine N-acetyltransferase